MRFASALAALAVVLWIGILVSQTAPSPTVAGRPPIDYRLDDGIGAVAFYPGAGYRSFVAAKFLVSSFHDLESQIIQLPRGAVLHWLPHRWDTSGNPILFAGGQYEQFVRLCSDHGIQILIERTYRPHLDADGTYTRTVVAVGDNGKSPIEFRSIKVHPRSPAGLRANEYILRMLYDPKTKLFYWEDYETYPGYAPEGDANFADVALQRMVIYIATDEITVFRLQLGDGLMIDVSTDRQNSLNQAQASAVSAIDKKARTPFQRSKYVTYKKQLPRDFFMQCMTDVDMPSIASVERNTNRWQVTIAAQNGNIAVLSLDDSYNLISIKTTLNPHADSVGGCKR